jgi:hypothetical protein
MVMSDWTVIDHDNDNRIKVDSRSEAEERKTTAQEFGSNDVEIVPPGETDGGEPQSADVVEVDADAETIDTVDAVDLENRDVTKDPMQWMPSHFIDEIQGVPAINRKGYAVLAQHCNISVRAEPVTRPAETDFEYAEFQAVAETEDGTEYTGYGSAHVDRDDDPTLLAELAETRAMKRATAWATGVGMTAVEEMDGQP